MNKIKNTGEYKFALRLEYKLKMQYLYLRLLSQPCGKGIQQCAIVRKLYRKHELQFDVMLSN